MHRSISILMETSSRTQKICSSFRQDSGTLGSIFFKNMSTLPETNSSHLKMDGWNTSFLLGWPIFTGYVRFREGIP